MCFIENMYVSVMLPRNKVNEHTTETVLHISFKCGIFVNIVRQTQSQMASFGIVIWCSFSTVPNKKSFMKQKKKINLYYVTVNSASKKKKIEEERKPFGIPQKYYWIVAENLLLKTNIGLNDYYYDGTFVASTCVRGRAVNIPGKAAQLFREAKNFTVFSEAIGAFCKLALLEMPRSCGCLQKHPATNTFLIATRSQGT